MRHPPLDRLPIVSALEASAPNPLVRLVAPYRVTVGAAAVQLTASGNVHGIVLKAICPGQTIYVGVSSSVTTATGYPLSDGETLTLEVQNANQIYAIASAAAQSVAILPFERRSVSTTRSRMPATMSGSRSVSALVALGKRRASFAKTLEPGRLAGCELA
jgi:hypothetical protein